MKYTFLALALSLFLNTNVYAEEAKTIDNSKTSEMPVNLTYVGIGGISIDTSAVNKSLSGLGYPAFPSNFTTFGTGNRTISGKIVTSGEGFFTIENKVLNLQNNHKAFNSSSFSLVADLGYVVFESHNLRIYPMVGVGIGRVFVDIFKDKKNTSYSQLIKDPDKGIALSSTNILADLAIGSDYTIGIGKSNPKKGGINIGLKVGYLLNLYSTGLQLKGESILDAPAINNSGFYARLNLGYSNGIILALMDIF